MNLLDIYAGHFLDDAAHTLQDARFNGEDHQAITKLGSPEVMPDALLIDFLAINYEFTVDRRSDGSFIMGEVGGIIPTDPHTGHRVIAIAERSVEKVIYGIQKIQESDNGNPAALQELERIVEMPVIRRAGSSIINGNRNIAHYDFTTRVAPACATDLLVTHANLLLAADGFGVFSNKSLPTEHYTFSIPAREDLLVKVLAHAEPLDRLRTLKESEREILPEGFLAGMHVIYEGKMVTIHPIIPERDYKKYAWLSQYHCEPRGSDIMHLGTSGSDGSFSTFGKRIIDAHVGP
jgi:hypothetical protein